MSSSQLHLLVSCGNALLRRVMSGTSFGTRTNEEKHEGERRYSEVEEADSCHFRDLLLRLMLLN
jgi:hypothetical protein